MNVSKHTTRHSLLLHLGTGIPAAAVFVLLARPAALNGLPPLLPFLACALLILVPVQVGIMLRARRKSGEPVIAYSRPVHPGKTALVVTACLAWAVLSFALLEPLLARPLKQELFAWWPRMLTLGDYLMHPKLYSREARILTWSLGILAAIVVPLCEEVYFRGYLMPRMPFQGVMVPAAHTLLFVLYHFWSPWLFPVRVIAVFPLYYWTWRARNIHAAVIVHVLLNLVGDVLTTVPAVFGTA